jgi:hypothetical protein
MFMTSVLCDARVKHDAQENSMQKILRYFNDYNPAVPVYEWEGENLHIPLNGIYDINRIESTLLSIKETVKRSPTPYWTRMMELTSCVKTSKSEHKRVMLCLAEFYQWAKSNGCYAAAVVIPESQLEKFMELSALSSEPHNGIRVFFDKQQAESWLVHQQNLQKAKKLH